MEPPWDQVYARDVPPDFEEMRKREDRKERIKPYWDLLVNDKEPKVNKDSLIRLMHDLKEEGNALFKDSHFDIAWMHYRNAIFVVRILENRFYHTVEKEFTSSLFSNRAFCCLKKSMFKEAVQDCESAIGVFPKNIKAYYRQALAYKNLKKFSEAYRSACKGQEMQPSSALKELIDELEPKIKVGSRSAEPQGRPTAEVSAKSATVLSTVDDDVGPDNEWLTGTNIAVTQKQLETRSKMSKKTKKKNKGSTSPVKNVVVSSIEPETESDDPSPAEYEDDTEFANLLLGVQKNTTPGRVGTLNGRMSSGGLDIIAPPTVEETPWSSFPHDVEEDLNITVTDDNQTAMGLDSFSPEVQSAEIMDSEAGSLSYSNTSSGRSSRASQSPSKFVTVPSRTSSATPSPGPPNIPQINFPLAEEFDFKISCRHCFSKIGEGVKGYRYVNAAHQCLRDVLILKKKNIAGLSWIKVRARPETKGHYGSFKICTQFSQNKPCKVAEEKCTFPHHQAEASLWTIDRDGTFSIENFITQCRTYKIYDTEGLTTQKSKQQYIPGLNYSSNKKKPTLEIVDGSKEKQSGPIQSSAVVKVPSTQSLRPNIPQSVPQNRFSAPQSALLSHPPPASLPVSYPPPSPGQHMPQFTGLPPTGFPQHVNGYNYGQFSQPPPPVPSQRTQWSLQTPTVIEEPDQPGFEQQQPVAKLENPLVETHNAYVVCQHCFKATMYPGIYEYISLTHKCEETMLAMRRKSPGEPYVRVRERKNHREFPGNYILCNSIRYKNPSFCKYGEELCSFAHNDVERYFWTLEKDAKFNITEFLIQNRKFAAGKGFSLEEILGKHGGYFEFICRACYYGTPPKISLISSDPTKCNGDPPGHPWKDFKILAHVGPGGVFTLINPRGFLHKSAFFKICKWLQFCRSRVNATCRFAHSMIERDIWMLERDCGIKRSEIASQSKQIVCAPPGHSTGFSSSNTKVTKPTPTVAVTAPAAPELKQQVTVQSTESSGIPAAPDGLCPITVLEVCETCWKRGQRTQQQAGKDRCQKGHGNWSCNIVYLLSPSLKELRPLPRKIPSGLNFIICQYVRDGKKCGYSGRGPCQFAHCVEEMEAWKFMCANNLTTPTELSQASKAAQKARAESAKSKISGQSVVSVSMNPVSASRPAMPVTSVHTFYCHYCGVSCNSQKQWDEHCASEKHNFNVNSDREHQWNYRQPPWTSGRFYELCEKHNDGGQCQYSNVPEMYNLCRYAHSQDELDEWKERYEWRQMKREMARQEKVFSYMDELLEKYENSTEPVNVITEELDGVEVTVKGDLHIYREEKQAKYIWTFQIVSLKRIEKIALLYNRDRLHFSLVNGMEKSCQISQGDMFCHNVDHHGKPLYEIQLSFSGGMFGSFMQWILFDFGPKLPVLCRKVTVEIGNQSSHEKVKNLRQQLQFDRWTSLNREIVRHEIMEDIEEMLVRKYKEPSSSEIVVTQTTVTMELNRHNYKAKMHKLLELEEMTRHQTISSYNLCVTIECLQAIEEATYVFAMAGELFARVPLQENLTEDTDAGKLILTSVRKVLLAPRSDSSKVVYEASIVNKENFEFDGRGRDFIYLCLSPECVKRLGLRPGTSLDVEIQFQMDRLFLCRMHYAIDQLQTSDIVFPDVPKINPLRNEKHNLRISSSVLNPDQMSAVRHIVAERTGYTPPFVLFGPFGTGKTETLAQATMVLLKETKDTRILICAQSNSAADLYIVKHFDTFLKKSGNQALLKRVYFKDRLLYTVSPQVKNYCLLTPDGDAFQMPTRTDIEKCRVVIVTVTTSLVLANLGLQGMFTHIFIDEAAQTLESESLMPLTLATEKTCIVLAGDHRQISPKVYSMEARNQNLHQSLLERLHQYYDSHSTFIPETSPLNILLSINYRTKMEILRFISAVFYGGPEVLKSEANIRSVLSITPLAFYAVQGREVQDENSISYYNMSEVQEVVDRVDDLFDKWPEEWGTPSAKEIGVVTPYYDQVILIRKALKKRNMALKDVIVERVQGVQGKEFRAMFITTVRTRHLIEAPHVQSHALTECDGEGGDFGFLSDSKLLNTALTRAQSLVVVVGDPVALCAVGECVNVWRTYIKHCQNMSSLYPQNHTFDSIRQQVQNLLNSPARERLLQIANERQGGQKIGSLVPDNTVSSTEPLPGYSSVAQPAIGTGSTNDYLTGTSMGNNKYDNTTAERTTSPVRNNGTLSNGAVPRSPLTPLNPLRTGITRGLPPAPLTSLTQRKSLESYYEVGDEFTFDPDDVLLQLLKLEGNGVGTFNITKDRISVREENGQAVVRGGGNAVVENGAIYPSYDDKQLKALLTKEGRYLRTRLHIDSEGCKAEVLEGASKGIELDIPSRWMCGQGNDNDEVVVEHVTEGNQRYGKVVGVLKTAVDLKNRYIVCTVGDNGGVMVPIDSGLSPMFNVTTTANLHQNKEDSVIVYRFTKSKQVRLSHMEKFDILNRSEKLFITRFLKWDSKLQLPLCIVVGVFDVGTELATCMKVLELEHHLVKAYNPGIAEEVDYLYPDNFQLTDEMFNSRTLDLRECWCFTIDSSSVSPTSRAFSIDEIGDGNYHVGVHFTDVAAFVNKGSSVDIEAQSRGVACFPAQEEPIQMLPNKLSIDLCDLKPGEDKLAFSVMMTVKPTGEVMQVNVQKTIINCKKGFSMREAQDIIQDPTAHEDYLKSCVLVLFEIARLWRKERLGNASLYHENVLEKSTSFACQLVEDMVVMTEFHIAQIVLRSFPEVVPLFVQEAPDSQALGRWRQEHAADAVNSIALTKPFLNSSLMEICKCGLACTHTVNFVRQANIVKREQIDVVSSLWDSLNDAVGLGDFATIQDIIVSPENHPQLSAALYLLQSIQQAEEFVCSSEVINGNYHYTINCKPYTHITQPLSCYIDIVVQRLLTACLDSKPCPYTRTEIQAICSDATKSLANRKKFEEETRLVQLSSALLSRPLLLHSVIVNSNLENIQMCFSSLLSVISPQNVDLVSLGICEPPSYSESGGVVLKWRERVYDYGVLQHQAAVGSSYGELNPDRFIYKIPAFQWQRLLIAIREQDEGMRVQKLNSAVEIVRKQVTNPALVGNYIEDVTSEVHKLGNIKHVTEFSLQLSASQLLLVQLSATSSSHNPLLSPYIQLFSLTNHLDICVQHAQHPDTCFANRHNIVEPSTANCTDIGSYQKVWMPVLELEAASKAVENSDRILVNNVPIEWKQEAVPSTMIGYITLPLTFMKQRQIKISSNFEQRSLFNPDNISYCNAYFSDFVCIRYSNVTLPNNSGLSEEVAQLVNTGGIFTWVGHCTVIGVALGNGTATLKLQLVQSDVPLPVMLVRRRMCTIELIMRTEADRMMMYSLRSLEYSTKLAQDVILRQTPTNTLQFTDVDLLLNSCKGVLHVPNQQQEAALKMSLEQPLTVIQGCVGSGKSMMAAKLSFMYIQRNRGVSGPKRQVLMCAPREVTLDILTDYFLSLKTNCPRVVRVYSNSIERVVHPSPKDVTRIMPYSSEDMDDIKANYSVLSLYNLVRSSGSPFSKHLTEYETLFSLYPDDISEDQFDEFSELLAKAETTVLTEAEVILCTCVTAGLPKITSNTNIQQIIIDDANSGSELELLVPLSLNQEANQVAIIGDVNQIGPKVTNEAAKVLGLGRSIMRDYLSLAVYLNVQYRVHEGIADFPSKNSYEGRLLCGTMSQRQPSILNWPAGRTKPVAFCKLKGSESTQIIDVGSQKEDTVCNIDQADFAVRVAVSLVTSYQVPASNVAVICTTRAQRVVVRDKLSAAGNSSSCLTIAEAQGKEYDYVILCTVRTVANPSVERYPDKKWKLARLGQLVDKAIVTTALTRAKKGLVIVGNDELLRCDALWAKLLADYGNSGRIVTADTFLKSMSM